MRTDWEELSPGVRAAVEHRTGPVQAAYTVSAGKNSALAAILATAQRGSVFVKGLWTEDPRVVSQDREAVVSPYVRSLSRELLWQTKADGWNLLGFQAAPGRHADYSPSSDDVPKVIEAIRRLGRLRCPDLHQLKYAEQRWAKYVDHQDDLALLCGQSLLHTDYSPDNVLVDGNGARLIDWAWPTRGAGFIDPACLVVRLVYAGHPP
ncbi:MAG TPA: phosphotransferase, partial [Micromonosporaceae bacterium]|nr:phosphotransferase [Micromonosporaceae bacterium]